MARRFFVPGVNASGSANKTILNLTGGTTVRTTVDEIILGSSAVPADQAAQYQLLLQTADGSGGTTPTPTPTPDPADPASTTAARSAASSEPTYGVAVWQFSLHQRASWRYVCDTGKGFIAPATAAHGWGLRLVSATAAVVQDGVLYYTE